jgi:hypothetical protein
MNRPAVIARVANKIIFHDPTVAERIRSGCSIMSTLTTGWLESHLHVCRPTALYA